MTSPAASYHGYRFPLEIISHTVWLYHRFCLSFRDTEDLLAQRGITVSYEAIRQWCRRFGPAYARILQRRQGRLGDTWHLHRCVRAGSDQPVGSPDLHDWPPTPLALPPVDPPVR